MVVMCLNPGYNAKIKTWAIEMARSTLAIRSRSKREKKKFLKIKKNLPP
jgi:hypothetical protein